MKERPILFNAPMVRAILDGRKTQTRRVVKRPKGLASGDLSLAFAGKMFGVTPGLHVPMPDGSVQRLRNKWDWPEPSRLWVRETWAFDEEDNRVLYRADDNEETKEWDQARAESGLSKYRWRPSIHMPRVASRVTLEIVSVRVERLQDISEADAIAEGVGGDVTVTPCFAVERYRALWESINGPGSWDANPWAWVVEFKPATRDAAK